jgi:hypothetical protein
LIVLLISQALGIYSIILNIFSLMASQRMSGGKATGSVLIPIGVGVLLFVALYCALIFVAISVANSAVPH